MFSFHVSVVKTDPKNDWVKQNCSKIHGPYFFYEGDIECFEDEGIEAFELGSGILETIPKRIDNRISLARSMGADIPDKARQPQ